MVSMLKGLTVLVTSELSTMVFSLHVRNTMTKALTGKVCILNSIKDKHWALCSDVFLLYKDGKMFWFSF